MKSTRPDTLTIVWLALTALTLSSGWLSEPHGTTLQINATLTMSVLLMAFIKCRLIMRHFMEVKRGPRALRWFSELWLAGFFGAVALVYGC